MKYEAKGDRENCLICLRGKMETVKSLKQSYGFHEHYFYQIGTIFYSVVHC